VLVTTRLNPYLNFRDTASQAMDFYQSVFGGEITRSTFADIQMPCEPGEEGKVLHSQLEAPNGLVLMAADVPKATPLTLGSNYSVSLSGEDEAELGGYFEKLADGGSVTMPLGKAPWGDTFGALTDKFGVSWLVNIAGSPS
jgi:PhnB protein